MYKLVLRSALVLGCFCMAGVVGAAEPQAKQSIPESSLSAMGLSGLQTASPEARQVRGEGARVRGTSFAVFFGGPVVAGSVNSYSASFDNFAAGGSASFGGVFGGPVVFGAGLSAAGGF